MSIGSVVNAAGVSAVQGGSGGSAHGSLLNIQVFTSTGTYTPTAGTNSVIVELQAAGGGSGGTSTTGAAQTAASGGGSAGAYGKGLITSAFSGVTVTIGNPGGGGGIGANGGAAGGASFGTLMTAGGGRGGALGAVLSAAGFGGAGGTAATAPTFPGATQILSIIGQLGGSGVSYTLDAIALGGQGGDSQLGVGGAASQVAGTSVAGAGYGAGAAGNYINASTTGVVGLAGQGGVCVIYELS